MAFVWSQKQQKTPKTPYLRTPNTPQKYFFWKKYFFYLFYNCQRYLEQLLFWAKYHFLTLKRQFFQKHGFLGNFGRYSYNKYIASRPQKEGSWSNRKKRDRAMKLLVCHQWHRRSTKSSWDQEKIHFHVLCTTLMWPTLRSGFA